MFREWGGVTFAIIVIRMMGMEGRPNISLTLLLIGNFTATTPTANEETIAVPAGSEATITHPSQHSVPGEVMVIGQGDVGQLGLGEEVLERSTPAPVVGMKESSTQVVCGGMHTVALSKEGKVSVLMADERMLEEYVYPMDV